MHNYKKSSKQHAPKARSATSGLSALPLGVLGGMAIIALAVFLAYLPSINGDFILDDGDLVMDNPLIKASDGLYRFWCTTQTTDYWPVTNTSFWIEWRMWGMNSTGYHVTNLILHIVESLLIWVILRKLSIPGAFLAALIFALHPVNVESVSWISQRKNTMALLFFLLSILCYLKLEVPSLVLKKDLYRIASPPGDASMVARPSPLWYWLSLAAFLLAMLSKGSVAVLPVLLLGIVWWCRTAGTEPIFAKQKWDYPLYLRDYVRIMPFFAVAMVLSAVNMWFQTHGTGEVIRTASFAERLLGAGGVVWFYLYKALLPIELVFVYPQWHVEPVNPLWWLPLIAAAVVTAALWRYRNSWGRPFLFAWGFFCVALAPVMGFLDAGFMKFSLVADHYQHIAIIAVIALASAGFNAWHHRLQGTARRAAMLVAIAIVSVLIFLTWRQSRIYRDPITLYQATLEKNPSCWMPYYNLGLEVAKTGRLQEAIELYNQALKLKPDSIDAYNNLGVALADTGRPMQAIANYEKALRLQPNDAEAHNNMGNVLLDLNRVQEAIPHFNQALRLKPDYFKAHYNLGNAFNALGRYQQAIEHYEKSLQLNPGLPEARNNLGNTLFQSGRPQEAIEQYLIALRLKPVNPEAQNNLGLALVKTGRPKEAIEHYRQALMLKPDFTMAYYNMALAYARMRQPSEAIVAAQKALEIANSRQQTALVKQIENWLNSYRASLSN